MIGLVLLIAAAEASALEPFITLSLVHAFDRPQAWGVRLSGDLLVALGDQCVAWDVPGEDCRTSEDGPLGSLWPEVGPGVAVSWRGRDRFGAQLHGAAGVGSLDVWDVGFLPYWELLGTAGLAVEVDSGASLLVGGRVTKSLTPYFFTLTASRSTFGALDGLAVRAELAAPRTAAGWGRPVLGIGLQACTYASTDQ